MTVENCSEGGALLKGTDASLAARAKVLIMIDGLQAPITGHVLTVSKNGVHVKFDASADMTDKFAEQFKRLAAGLAPLAEAA